MQLSEHFTLAEMQITLHREIDNTAPAEIVSNLIDTAGHMELVRHMLGDRVISVSSGYRCPELNKLVGGSAFSAHVTGHAVDFNCYSFGTPYAVCRALMVEPALNFDQMIQEGGWVHLSFDARRRREILTLKGGRYLPGILR